MSVMCIVHDLNRDTAYGPFPSRSEAEDWLATRGIRIGEYVDQEVEILPLLPITERLPDIP